VASRARELVDERKTAEALELLIPALEANPGDAELNLVYGLALLQNGQAGLAAWPLRRSAQDPAYRVKSGVRLAQALLVSRNGYEAVREAQAVLELEPDNSVALNILARAHVQMRDHDQAVVILDRLLEATPDDLKLAEARLTSLLQLERVDEAATALARMVELAESRTDLRPAFRAHLCARSARIKALQDEKEEAERLYGDCLARFPGRSEVLRDVLQFYDGSERPERATEILRAQADARPKDLGLQSWFASRLQLMGEPEEAERRLLDAAETLDTPEAWTAVRNFRVSQDDLEGAVEAIDRALQAITGTHPSEASFDYSDVGEQKLFEYADVVVQAGHFDRVQRMLAPIREESYKRLLTARLHYEQGHYREALDAWEQAFLLWPSNAVGRYLAAHAAMRLREWERVVSHLRESVRAGADATDAGLVLARIHLAQGQLEPAFDVLGHHVRAHPADVDALRLQAQITAQTGREEITQTLREGLVSRYGMAAEVLADHARDLWRFQGPEVGLRYLEDAEAGSQDIDLATPDYAEALDAWWELTVGVGRPDAALARVERAAAAHPESGPLQVLHARALLTSGRSDEARAALALALEDAAPSMRALMTLGALEVTAGNVDAAVAAYDRAAERDPDDPDPRITGATLLASGDDQAEASRRLRAILEQWAWRGDAAHTLAHLALENGDTGAETLALAEEGARFLAVAGPGALQTLGRAQLERGMPELAADTLQRGLALGLSGPRPHFYLGQALARLGQPEEAAAALEAALGFEDFAEAEVAQAQLDELRALVD
jgi:tetratricopeptide (TPR) repeat protein